MTSRNYDRERLAGLFFSAPVSDASEAHILCVTPFNKSLYLPSIDPTHEPGSDTLLLESGRRELLSRSLDCISDALEGKQLMAKRRPSGSRIKVVLTQATKIHMLAHGIPVGKFQSNCLPEIEKRAEDELLPMLLSGVPIRDIPVKVMRIDAYQIKIELEQNEDKTIYTARITGVFL
ncbi:MAG: hypothetical protein AAGI37_11660 [Planctomycetota bacterium]